MTGGRDLAAEHDAAGRHEDAINALAVASRSGDVEATAELGQRLIVGDRAPYMPAQGAGLVGDAARAGSINALLSFACLMALGAHVPRSLNGAVGLLVHAAELGSETARGQLRVLSRQGAARSPREDWRQLARAIDLAGWLSPPPGITLHDEPLVRRFPALLEPALCDWLIDKARIRLRPAMIYSGEGAGDRVDEMRTNSVGVWDLGCMDLINVVLQYRIAAACRMPLDNLEAPTALRYRVGEQITNHYDFVNPRIPNYQSEIDRRGQRIVTFLVYLNDDYEGGETDFPTLGLRYHGAKGNGIFFTNALPNGQPDLRMVHAGLPPKDNEKWLMSQFIRNRAVLGARAENQA